MSQYSVKTIIGRRMNRLKIGGIIRDQRQYLIHWEGYEESQSTWEPIKNLRFVLDMVKQYDEYHDSQTNNKQSQEKSLPSKLKKMSNQRKLSIDEDEKNKDSTKHNIRKISKYAVSKQRFKENSQKDVPHTQTTQSLGKTTNPKMLKKQKKEKKKDTKKIQALNLKQSRFKLEIKKQLSDHAEQKDENLKVLGMHCDHNNEFVFLVQNNVGLRTYKNRAFMVKEHPQSLICFYQSNISFGSSSEKS